MALANKESLLPAPAGKRRTKVLRNDADTVQMQGATLQVEDDEGSSHHFIQIRTWTKTRGWTAILLDEIHDVISIVGPYRREDDSWKATIRILEAKGYWAEV